MANFKAEAISISSHIFCEEVIMIISASRRTDIPAFYSPWFLNRITEGYVMVRNPMNIHQISRISLSPDVVDGIVFWTKNPAPMLDKLDALKDYMYYFQFTLTAYGKDVEPNVPDKDKVILPAFQRLSEQIGSQRVIWRYDPIFLSEKYTVDYHIRRFEELAKVLHPYTDQCVISFLDFYRNAAHRMEPVKVQEFPIGTQRTLAQALANIGQAYGLRLSTCSEQIDLSAFGIGHAHCIDPSLFEKLLGCPLQSKKDKNQRLECGCAESIDIGAYDTCPNGCLYCYATFSEKSVRTNLGKHIPASPLIIGQPGPEDKISDRKVSSQKVMQISLDWPPNE